MAEKQQTTIQQNGELLTVLQQALNTEMTVSNHYWARAVYWQGNGVKKLAQMYEKEATEERGHAQLVADRMIFLDGAPKTAPSVIEAVEGNLKTQFSEDLDGEVEVANQYTGWTQTALAAKDFGTYAVLQKILDETEAHVDWLQNELQLIAQLGEPIYFQGRWLSVD
jgi:bacterioferritin